jgi:glycosyltransferase involved in cell wall biosynthesis
LFYAKLVPLVRSRPDIELVVVTDRQGPAFERVTWIWPKGLSARFGRLGGRLMLLVREVFHPRTQLVMAYNLVPHGMFATALARLRGLPVFLHFIAGAAEVHFAYNPKISHNRMIFHSKHPERIERWANRAAHRADKIFVPGRMTADYLTRHGFPKEQIEFLHSTVDPALYYCDNAPRDLDVVVVAQILENKRPIHTLQVLAEVKRHKPDAHFCWLGDGPMREEFAAAVKELGLTDALTWTTTNDVAPYYRRSKMFLLCSLSEGLSLGCMEAMGCGVVPVTSDIGDMREVVRPEETGQPVAVEAPPEESAQAVLRFLTDEPLWRSYSANCARLITAEHSFPSAIEAWRRVLAPLDK